MFADSRKLTWAMLAALGVMGALLYANTLQVPFYLDDAANIQENRAIQLKTWQFSGLLDAGAGGFVGNRPIAYISFALNYLFFGENLAGFHVVNTIIHVLTAVFLFLLLLKTFELPTSGVGSEHILMIAFAGALLWLVHPLHTQSVTYIVQRMNSMAAMFFVLSLYCYVQGRTLEGKTRQGAWLAGACLSGLLALGTKENAATLPFFILLYEWYFIRDLSVIWLRKQLPVMIGVLVAVSLIAFYYLGTKPLASILASYAPRDFTLAERVLTQFRVVMFYGSLLLLPHYGRLSLEHDFSVSHSFFDPLSTGFAMLSVLALLVFAVYLARRERFISFAIVWFLGNLVIESSVIGLEMVFEHRTYLPSMLVVAGLVVLLGRYVKQSPFWTVVGVVVLVFSLWTIERNNQWRNPVEFWQDCVRKAPASPRPYNNLGLVLAERGETEAAIVQYRESLRRKPAFLMAHNNLGVALQKQGKFREAAEHLLFALQSDPFNAKLHNNLGSIYARLNDFDKSARHLNEALRIDPGYGAAHNNKANLLMLQGRFSEAISHYRQALAINPENGDARFNLERALALSGQLPGSPRP